jgi:UDP-MurNAc hydroxylase
VSHEHKDHFDLPFLDSLQSRDFTLVIPEFRRTALADAFAGYRCTRVVRCPDEGEVPIPGGKLKLYLDDSELNRDSAILIKGDGQTFLNLNDCRIADALPGIARSEGPIDAFAMQFSGASWHPICYEYPSDRYRSISHKKVMAKFHSVAHAIKIVNPGVFLPSAGPPCFLDPMLVHLNFEQVNIFPRASRLIPYLEARLPGTETQWPDLMPGDVVEVDSGRVVFEASERVTEETLRDHITAYAHEYDGFFEERKREYTRGDAEGVLDGLKEALGEKLERFELHDRVNTFLYFRLSDIPDRSVKVDFRRRAISYANGVQEPNYYSISAPTWEVARVLDKRITWEDFAHTFRVRLSREPDIYQTLVTGFLRMQPDDLDWFCRRLLSIEDKQERIVKEVNGTRYAVDRYCPHQGGDLQQAWVEEGRFLTCPRHGWQFDLEKGGECHNNDGTIHAMCLDED